MLNIYFFLSPPTSFRYLNKIAGYLISPGVPWKLFHGYNRAVKASFTGPKLPLQQCLSSPWLPPTRASSKGPEAGEGVSRCAHGNLWFLPVMPAHTAQVAKWTKTSLHECRGPSSSPIASPAVTRSDSRALFKRKKKYNLSPQLSELV